MKYLKFLSLALIPLPAYAASSGSAVEFVRALMLYGLFAIVLLCILIFFYINKSRNSEDRHAKSRLVNSILVLLLTSPVYSYLGESPYVIWLCLMNLWLLRAVILELIKSNSFNYSIVNGLFIISVVYLSLITPDFLNLYVYEPIENQVLTNPQKIIAIREDGSIQLVDGMYQAHNVYLGNEIGKRIELVLREDTNEYEIYLSEPSDDWYHSETKNYNALFNFPVLEKKFDKYARKKHTGYLTKLE